LPIDLATSYQQAVREIVPFLTAKRIEAVARHNPGWQHLDLAAYLENSQLRYQSALNLFQRHAGERTPLTSAASWARSRLRSAGSAYR
jgi:hypothetical protein